MVNVFLGRLGSLIGFVLLQVLVLNNIHIAGYATPFLYIYMLLKFETEMSRNQLLIWGFVLGLLVDLFSNTPGMHAAATVLLAFARPLMLQMFMSRDVQESIIPSFGSVGVGVFIKYLITCVLFHHTALLLIESFSLFNLPVLLLKIVLSSLLTLVCILAIEVIKR